VMPAQESTVTHYMILLHMTFSTYESLVSHMGVIWRLLGGEGQHMGASFTIWGPYGCHMGAVHSPYGSGVRCTGAVWEPCAHVAAMWCQIGVGW
jgi:hypothetical protein